MKMIMKLQNIAHENAMEETKHSCKYSSLSLK